MKTSDKPVYIYDSQLIQQCDRIPVIISRASRVHDLISSYELLDHFTVTPSQLATKDQLRLCHSGDYLDVLEELNTSGKVHSDDEGDQNDSTSVGEEFGLGYDCPRFPKLFEFCQRIAGGTLSAADALIDGARVAVNWCGGWHHAQRDTAEGFCYVNDIVIGIQRLLQGHFQRVLYIDMDIHHGNGVENALSSTKRVFTLSFHQHEAGFFPGTGEDLEAGFGSARGYAVNFPFKQHISGQSYQKYFKRISTAVMEKYKPDAIVLQCGADVLAGDPLGGANLTTIDMGECLMHVQRQEIPMMVLGGGGYNLSNTARYWAYLSSLLCGIEIDEDVPDNEFFLDYGPTYELHVERKWLKDENDPQVLEKNCQTILRNLENI